MSEERSPWTRPSVATAVAAAGFLVLCAIVRTCHLLSPPPMSGDVLSASSAEEIHDPGTYGQEDATRTQGATSPWERPDSTINWASAPQSGRTSLQVALGAASTHAATMGLSESEYIAQAVRFVREPPATAVSCRLACGDFILFDPPSRRFALRTADGVPAAYFVSERGLDYWRQSFDEALIAPVAIPSAEPRVASPPK